MTRAAIRRAVLVNPPRTNRERTEIAPPLGLLRLAAIAQRAGAEVAIEDFNLLWHLMPRLQTHFYEAAVARLLSLDADLYGFTSMAVDSHVALELGRRLKAARPEAILLYGGTHFSSISHNLQSIYPWVDRVIVGPGEAAFAAALLGRPADAKDRGTAALIEGVTGNESTVYSLVSMPAYLHVNPLGTVNVEVGRGCRYRCGFCYSTAFYGGHTDDDIVAVVRELAALRALGASRVFFVGDNLLNNPTWVKAFCMALEEARLGFTWCAYATLPDLTPELIDLLGRAGCTQLFMGVDVVGRTAERAFHKRFVAHLDDFRLKLRALDQAGIQPTCGFILAPPSHSASADRETTLETALHARLEGADIAINALSLYTGTHTRESGRYAFAPDPLQPRLLMDVPEIVEDNSLAAGRPDQFPFHSRYVSASEWNIFLRFAHAAHTVLNTLPESLAEQLRTAAVIDRAPLGTFITRVTARTEDILTLAPEARRAAEWAAAAEMLGVERATSPPTVATSAGNQPTSNEGPDRAASGAT